MTGSYDIEFLCNHAPFTLEIIKIFGAMNVWYDYDAYNQKMLQRIN